MRGPFLKMSQFPKSENHVGLIYIGEALVSVVIWQCHREIAWLRRRRLLRYAFTPPEIVNFVHDFHVFPGSQIETRLAMILLREPSRLRVFVAKMF